MAKKSKPVEIIGVDTGTVERDDAFPDAYAFYMKLSEQPDPIWERYLLEWRNALHQKRKEIRVEGDKLRLVFVYGDNIQDYVKYATLLVKMTNERVEKHNKQVELQEKRNLAKQEANQKKEDEIRKNLRELEPEPMPAAIEVTEVTVEELLSAYEADGETADARFGNKILKVTGAVDRIEVKDILGIHYIILTGAEKNLLQNVRCMFDKGHGDDLNQLIKGQLVTVQGRFDGSIIELRLRDCVLVR